MQTCDKISRESEEKEEKAYWVGIKCVLGCDKRKLRTQI